MLKVKFEMKELGEARKILGIEISRDTQHRKIYLSQKSYLAKVLSKFKMLNAKAVGVPFAPHFKLSSVQSPKSEEERKEMSHIPYSSAVGSLMYSMVCTWPDLAHSMSIVSRFMANPRKVHWNAVKWMFKYLTGTLSHVLTYGGAKIGVQPSILGYLDADYAADINKRRSTSGWVFRLWNSTISWKSSLQHVVALSTTKAEYIALSKAFKEAI